MNTAAHHALEPILDAIEKVYGGQWSCRKAVLEDGFWAFVFVDAYTNDETEIGGVRADKAVPILRDMLARAEVSASVSDEESS